MDLSYATIPTFDNTFVRLHRELERRYQVENPKEQNNEMVYVSNELGIYAVLSNFMAPIEDKIKVNVKGDLKHHKAGPTPLM